MHADEWLLGIRQEPHFLGAGNTSGFFVPGVAHIIEESAVWRAVDKKRPRPAESSRVGLTGHFIRLTR